MKGQADRLRHGSQSNVRVFPDELCQTAINCKRELLQLMAVWQIQTFIIRQYFENLLKFKIPQRHDETALQQDVLQSSSGVNYLFGSDIHASVGDQTFR